LYIFERMKENLLYSKKHIRCLPRLLLATLFLLTFVLVRSFPTSGSCRESPNVEKLTHTNNFRACKCPLKAYEAISNVNNVDLPFLKMYKVELRACLAMRCRSPEWQEEQDKRSFF